MVYTILKPFLNLCLLNANPQDLPASQFLLVMSLILYLVVSVALALPVYGLNTSLTQALLEITMLIAYTWLILVMTSHGERLTQTLSALAGTGVIFGFIALPIIYSIYESTSAGGVGNVWTVVAYFMITGWLLVVYGHVFRNALSSGLFMGMLVSLGYIVLTSMIMATLFQPRN